VRLFVALEIPAEVRERLAALLGELRAIAPQMKWVRAENLHVTLKFIGHVEHEKLDAIRSALAGVRSEHGVALEFRGLGFFPNEKRPRVFWAGIEASSNLKLLAADIEAAMEKMGVAREERPFAAHLTLARFQGERLPDKLRAAIAAHTQDEFGALHTREFHLIESKLKLAGAEYTTLETFPFAAEN
jgi:RNA 2',3'-cyclic 3'-phosphodiesterase